MEGMVMDVCRVREVMVMVVWRVWEVMVMVVWRVWEVTVAEVEVQKKLRERSEFPNVWGEYKNHSNRTL